MLREILFYLKSHFYSSVMIILYYNTIILVLFLLFLNYVYVCGSVHMGTGAEEARGITPLRAGVKGINEILKMAARK